LMEAFQCARGTLKWLGDFDEHPWRKEDIVCGTVFYVAPPPKYIEAVRP
jgi:hypothetical protein